MCAGYDWQVMTAQSPSEIHAVFQKAFNRGDVEAMTSLYEPNAILLIGEEKVTGRENIRAALQCLVSGGGQMTLTTRSILESEGVALLHGDWLVQRPMATGARISTRGMSTEVVRRQPDGTWLFVIDSPYTTSMDNS